MLQPARDGPEEVRPRWQWVSFGALAILVVWVVLASATQLAVSALAGHGTPEDEVGSRSVALGAVVLVLRSGSLALAGWAGGFLLGRWGQSVGVRESATAGLVVASFAVTLSWAQGGVVWGALLALPLAMGPAAIGAWMGRRARAVGDA